MSMISPCGRYEHFHMPKTGGSWLSLAVKIVVAGAVYSTVLYALWRLAGRPEGIERRLLQVLSR